MNIRVNAHQHKRHLETLARAERAEADLAAALEMADAVVTWWHCLTPSLRQDIEGSGAVPGCIAKARAFLERTATAAAHVRANANQTGARND